MRYAVLSSVIGYAASLLLTLLAFFIIIYPDYLNLGNQSAINIILTLAVIQSIVQSIFFLKLMEEKAPRWNLLVFGSTISILLIVVFFSIWIMHHLNYHMMGVPEDIYIPNRFKIDRVRDEGSM